MYTILNYNEETNSYLGRNCYFTFEYPISSKFVFQTFIKNEYYGYTHNFFLFQ